MAVLLNDAGYEVCLAKTAAEGISKAITERPNFMLTDLELPDMIATEAIIVLKKIPVTSDIPIVVLTAEGDDRCRTKAIKAGAVEYLRKPISPRDLVTIVRNFCRRRSLLTELGS